MAAKRLLPDTIGALTVTTAGTAVQANSGTSLYCQSIIFQAESGNSGNIYIGDSTVSATNGIELDAGQSVTFSASQVGGSLLYDLADFWADTSSNGDKVRILIERPGTN